MEKFKQLIYIQVRQGLQALCEKRKFEEIEDLHSNPSSDAYMTWLLYKYCSDKCLIDDVYYNRLWSLNDVMTEEEKRTIQHKSIQELAFKTF